MLSHIKIPHTWRFEETPRRLPRRPRHPTLPPTGHEGPAAPRPRPRRSLSVRFHASPAKGCPVGAQRGADMRAPRDRRRRASSHGLRGHLSIFFGETSIEALHPFLIGLLRFGLLSFRSALRTPFWMSLSSDTTISKYFLPLHGRPFTLLAVSFEARKFLILRYSRFLLLLPVLMLPGPAHLGDTLGLWGQRVGDPGSSHVLAHAGTPALLVRPTEVSSPFSVSAAAPHGYVRPPPPTPTHAPSETPTKAVPLSSFHRRGN